MDPTVGTFAGSIVELTDVPTEDILPPTEDILPPILPPTEDFPPASDNILVRFTVGITRPAHVRSCPKADKKRIVQECPLCADFVAKVIDGFRSK